MFFGKRQRYESEDGGKECWSTLSAAADVSSADNCFNAVFFVSKVFLVLFILPYSLLNAPFRLLKGGRKSTGRKPLLSTEGCARFVQMVHDAALELNCVEKRFQALGLFKQCIRDESDNGCWNGEINARTFERYLRSLELVTIDRGDVKNSSRHNAYMVIRNFLSFVCMVRVLYQRVNPLMFFSFDDFTVQLNGWEEKPTVLATKKSKKVLKDLNMGASTTKDGGKRRVVVFNCAISFGGTACKVMRIKDDNFTNYKMPVAYNMGDSFYVCLHHTSTPEEVIMKVIVNSCIIPSCLKFREQALASALQTLTTAAVPYSQSTATTDSQAVADPPPPSFLAAAHDLLSGSAANDGVDGNGNRNGNGNGYESASDGEDEDVDGDAGEGDDDAGRVISINGSIFEFDCYRRNPAGV